MPSGWPAISSSDLERAFRTMTSAHLAPVAALLLTAGNAATLVAEEVKPAASTVVAAATGQGRIAADGVQAAAWLDRRLTIDFTDVPLAKAVEDIGRQAGGTVLLDPGLPSDEGQKPVTFRAGQLEASDCLHWVAMVAGLQHRIVGGACLFLPADQPVPEIAGRCSLAGLDPQHMKRLDLPLSAEIGGEAAVAVAQAGRLLGLEVVFDPRIMVIESPRTVAFAARSLRGRDLLAWVCYLGGLQARVVQGRLFVEPAAAYGGF
jgi:type II secretory pathway component GspD/PulD (secretin)